MISRSQGPKEVRVIELPGSKSNGGVGYLSDGVLSFQPDTVIRSLSSFTSPEGKYVIRSLPPVVYALKGCLPRTNVRNLKASRRKLRL
jgi:hypothetical protein